VIDVGGNFNMMRSRRCTIEGAADVKATQPKPAGKNIEHTNMSKISNYSNDIYSK
jgi:hypothetical protein